MDEIKVNCKAADTLDIQDMTLFQSELKSRTDSDYEHIKKSILDYGFCAPFFIWEHDGINGLSRQQFLSKNFTTAVPHITKGKQTYIFVFDKKLRKEWQKKSVKYPKKEAVEKSCTSIVTTEKIVKENA